VRSGIAALRQLAWPIATSALMPFKRDRQQRQHRKSFSGRRSWHDLPTKTPGLIQAGWKLLSQPPHIGFLALRDGETKSFFVTFSYALLAGDAFPVSSDDRCLNGPQGDLHRLGVPLQSVVAPFAIHEGSSCAHIQETNTPGIGGNPLFKQDGTIQGDWLPLSRRKPPATSIAFNQRTRLISSRSLTDPSQTHFASKFSKKSSRYHRSSLPLTLPVASPPSQNDL